MRLNSSCLSLVPPFFLYSSSYGNSFLVVCSNSINLRTRTYFTILTVFALLGVMMFTSNGSMIQGQTESSSNLAINSSHPIVVRSHIATIDIFTVNSVSMSESFVIENTDAVPISSVNLWLNHSMSTLVVEDAEGSLIYNWYPITNTSNLVEVNFRSDVEQNETSSFIVKYDMISIHL